MATNYGFTDTAHGDAPYGQTYELSTTAQGGATIAYAPVSAGTIQSCYLTKDGDPNNGAWVDSLTQTVSLDVSLANMNIRARCLVGRTDGTNTILQEGTFTAYQTLTTAVTYTFSPVAPAWTDAQENVANQYYILFEFNNLDDMMQQSVTINLFDTGAVTADSYVAANIAAATRRVFIIS